MRRPFSSLVALLLGVAAAVAVGCGERSNLIPSSDAAALRAQLAQIKADVDAGNCAGLDGKLDQVHDDATNLPGKIDRGLRSRINDGVQALKDTAPRDCQAAADAAQTQTQPAPTTQTETIPTTPTETQTETQTTPTVPPDTTTTPVPTTTTPPPSDATPPPTTTPGTSPPDNGGTPGDGAVPTP